jgi:hypothetical protein
VGAELLVRALENPTRELISTNATGTIPTLLVLPDAKQHFRNKTRQAHVK